MAAFLALLSSLLWGTGDFLGGTISRRVHPVAVMQATQTLAGLGLLVVAIGFGEMGRTGAIPWGAAAGALGFVGLGAFYAALAAGTMGVVAPIAATGVAIPVAVGLIRGDSPSGLQLLGIVVTVAGVIAASGPETGRADPETETEPTPDGALDATARTDVDPDEPPVHIPDRGLKPFLLAGVAAVCFGSALTLLAEGSQTSVALSLLVMRGVNATICTVLLLSLLRKAPRPTRADLPVLATIGATDATANGTFAVASTMGQISISAVLASLYPAVTALLAWKLHGEQLLRIQVAGVAATLLGVALIAGG